MQYSGGYTVKNKSNQTSSTCDDNHRGSQSNDFEKVPLLEEGKTSDIHVRRHQFSADSIVYFPNDSVLKELFAKKSRTLRFRLCATWGIMSLILGYFILHWSFGLSSGKSFFIG